MLNSVQLILLLPLIGAYLSPNSLDFIRGMKIWLFNFDFISFKFLQSNNVDNILDFDQNNSYLNLIGLESGSSALNIIQLQVLHYCYFCLLSNIIFATYKSNLLLFVYSLTKL